MNVQNDPKSSEVMAQHTLMTWKDCVREWYPNLLHKTHFMPNVYMNRVELQPGTEARPAAVWLGPQKTTKKGQKYPLQMSGVRDDKAQQKTLHTLRAIADGKLPETNEPEVMFVLSRMRFEDYLCKPCYAKAVDMLPRAADLKLKYKDLDRGDFDVLILHRHHGLVVGEVKSVGTIAEEKKISEQEMLVNVQTALRKVLKLEKQTSGGSDGGSRCRKKLGQLGKSKKVLMHVTQDLTPPPKVRMTLILPFITSRQLREAIEPDSELKEALCEDLDIPVDEDPVEFCLCSNQMSDIAITSWPAESLRQLGDWWRRLCPSDNPDPEMSDEMYEELVARFAGPASVISIYCRTEPRLQVSEMRTMGQAVSETHERLTQLALYPVQVDVLEENCKLVNLNGPPGTGKTLMLVLKAVQWRKENQPVHILSTRGESHGASFLIVHQVRKTLSLQKHKTEEHKQKQQQQQKKQKQVRKEQEHEQVQMEQKQVQRQQEQEQLQQEQNQEREDQKQKGQEQKEKQEQQRKDEEAIHVYFVTKENIDKTASELLDSTEDGQLRIIADEADGEVISALYDRLTSSSETLHLCMWTAGVKRKDFPKEFKVYTLTDPLRCPPAVVHQLQGTKSLQKREVPPYTQPSCPPPTVGPPVIDIWHSIKNGHDGEITMECVKCGQEIAAILLNQLHVGKVLHKTGGDGGKEPAINFRDVFVLSWDRDLIGEDSSCSAEQPSYQVVISLRRSGVPVRIVGDSDIKGIREMAEMSGPDAVTVTGVYNVWGLERKVVVWLGRSEVEVDSLREKTDYDERGGRLYCISRCTAQLIWVHDDKK